MHICIVVVDVCATLRASQWMKGLSTSCLALWMCGHSMAGVVYTPAERAWLDLLSRPVGGTASVYFIHDHRFGVGDVPFDRAIALKSGPECWFLFDGTDRVYRLMRGQAGPYLQRVDSTVHAGGFFKAMVFMRRDTIFRLGGYGFWRTKGFFTWFDGRTGRWKPYASASGLPSTLTLHHYDAAADVLYLAGAREHKPHENFRDQLGDSVYRFDFAHRAWSNLGRINPRGSVLTTIQDPTDMTAITSLGVIWVMLENTVLYDFVGNRTLKVRDRSKMLFYQFQDPRLIRLKYRRNFVQLGDSLFMVGWTDSSARAVGIPLGLDMFQEEPQESISMEGRAAVSSASAWPSRVADGLLVTVLLLLVGAGFSATAPGRRLRLRILGSRGIGVGLAGTEAAGSLVFFVQQLRPQERSLLANLLRASAEGRSAGTDELNRWLGMARQATELQKIARNRALQQINSAFRLSMRVEGDLVERVRDIRDRRQVFYHVSDVYAAQLTEALAANGEDSLPVQP